MSCTLCLCTPDQPPLVTTMLSSRIWRWASGMSSTTPQSVQSKSPNSPARLAAAAAEAVSRRVDLPICSSTAVPGWPRIPRVCCVRRRDPSSGPPSTRSRLVRAVLQRRPSHRPSPTASTPASTPAGPSPRSMRALLSASAARPPTPAATPPGDCNLTTPSARRRGTARAPWRPADCNLPRRAARPTTREMSISREVAISWEMRSGCASLPTIPFLHNSRPCRNPELTWMRTHRQCGTPRIAWRWIWTARVDPTTLTRST
mmetsp:Transcript_46012/g.103678  ORF Transcript_46012/g.103678 Transcript_46012/m.103678 type:complete len:260 (-) Transcript_46012:23-802(-)